MIPGKIWLTLLQNFKDIGLPQKRNNLVIVSWKHQQKHHAETRRYRKTGLHSFWVL